MRMHGRSRGSKARRRSSTDIAWPSLLVGLAASVTLLASSACADPGKTPASQAPEPSARSARAELTQSTLIVSKENEAAPFNAPRKLAMPSGWRGEVWARVPGARFAAWTPQGQLLVSASGSGQVVELKPGTGGSAPSQTVLISGLTAPQGMAFDTV